MAEQLIGTDINEKKITSLCQIQGQPQVVEILKMHLDAYFKTRASCGNTDVSFGPVILVGPSGTGKTMVANVLHAEYQHEGVHAQQRPGD